MNKLKNTKVTFWNKFAPFFYGAIGSILFGLIILSTVKRGAIVVLLGLIVVALYAFVLKHQQGDRFRRLTSQRSPVQILGVLAVIVVSVAGAHYLNESFAWSSEGKTPIAATPEANQPAYWGNGCTKSEFSGNVMTFSASPNARLVVVKGGPWNVVYDTAPFTDLSAAINTNNDKPYAISHVIVCTTPVTPQTPTPPTPTPPVPTPTPPTPTPPTPTPTPPAPTPPTPTPPSTTPPAPTPPGPTTPTTPTSTPPAGTPPADSGLPVYPTEKLPNVGAGDIALLAAFALIGGYVIHTLYWHIRDTTRSKRPTR